MKKFFIDQGWRLPFHQHGISEVELLERAALP